MSQKCLRTRKELAFSTRQFFSGPQSFLWLANVARQVVKLTCYRLQFFLTSQRPVCWAFLVIFILFGFSLDSFFELGRNAMVGFCWWAYTSFRCLNCAVSKWDEWLWPAGTKWLKSAFLVEVPWRPSCGGATCESSRGSGNECNHMNPFPF